MRETRSPSVFSTNAQPPSHSPAQLAARGPGVRSEGSLALLGLQESLSRSHISSEYGGRFFKTHKCRFESQPSCSAAVTQKHLPACLPEPQFPNLQNGSDSVTSPGLGCCKGERVEVRRTKAMGLLEGSVSVVGLVCVLPFLPGARPRCWESTVNTLPKTSRRSVFWWLGFLFCFVLFGVLFFLPLMPPSNMLPVLNTAVASSQPLSLPPFLFLSLTRKAATGIGWPPFPAPSPTQAREAFLAPAAGPTAMPGSYWAGEAVACGYLHCLHGSSVPLPKIRCGVYGCRVRGVPETLAPMHPAAQTTCRPWSQSCLVSLLGLRFFICRQEEEKANPSCRGVEGRVTEVMHPTVRTQYRSL